MAQQLFPGQRPDEKVLFMKRRHWFVLLLWTVPLLLLLFVMFGIGLLIGVAVELNPVIWALVILALIALPTGMLVWRILDWENDHYILTNRRVIHIERVYFLFESRQEAPLSKVQDVTFVMPTPLHNVLDFGDVVAETAAPEGQIIFEAIPKPREIQAQILRAAGLREHGRVPGEQPEGFSFWRLLRAMGEFLARMLYPVYPRHGVIIWRKHWFVLLKALVSPAVGMLLTGVFISVALGLETPQIVVLILSLVFLLLVAWLVFRVIDWHNDIYILTADRVIDIEKRPFTREFRREANMGMIQNVSYEQPSFISKVLNFGNVRLETAGTLGEFTFDNVPRPREVQSEITRRLAAYRAHMEQEHVRREREQFRRMVEETLQELGVVRDSSS